MIADNNTNADAFNNKMENPPLINSKKERNTPNETLTQMKVFLDLLLKEIDKDLQSDNKKNHKI